MDILKKYNTFKIIYKNTYHPIRFIFGFFSSKYFNINLVNNIVLKNGLKFYIYSWSDINHLVELMKGYYNMHNIGYKNIILDVGANTGDFSVAISKKANKIYAIEPIKAVYDILLQNIKINNLTNIHTYNLAISDKSGKQKMNLLKKQTSTANLSVTGNLTVNCISWSAFYKRIGAPKKIDLLKLDIECGEYSLLNDSKILNYIQEIRMELHLRGSKNKIFLFLNLLKNYKFRLMNSSFDHLYAKIKDDIENNPGNTYELIFSK